MIFINRCDSGYLIFQCCCFVASFFDGENTQYNKIPAAILVIAIHPKQQLIIIV